MAVFAQSFTTKLLGVALLALLFIVPLGLTRDLVAERQSRLLDAEAEIARSQGRAQTLAPPLLVWTQRQTMQGEKGQFEVDQRHVLAPQSVDIEAALSVEQRRRGIFEVPVYTTRVRIQGAFAADSVDLSAAPIVPGSLRLLLPVVDLRGVRAIDAVLLNGQRLNLRSSGLRLFDSEGLAAELPLPSVQGRQRIPFDLQIVLSGTRELSAWPLAESTRLHLSGAWASPSFGGAYLPISRAVTASGFDARWEVLAVNREIPVYWIDNAIDTTALEATRFGVELYEPVGLYRMNERSLKYGLLFTALTFGLLFLIEAIGRVRFHPVQYLLVGAGLAVFYVLLLALSEHVGFAPAYLLAALALSAIVGAYASSAFGSWLRGLSVGGWLSSLYGFLYLMVRSEDYALLIGALGVLGFVAATMYLTRRIDWYALRTPAAPPLPQAAG